MTSPLVRILLVGAAIAAVVPATPDAQTESRLKAAVVSKFPQFVEWPSSVVDGRTTIDLCVGAPDPFGSDLDELVTGEVVNERPLIVRRVTRAMEVDDCHLLFLPSQARKGPHPFLSRAAKLPVLTIGDDPRFLDDGGIVWLRLVGGRVRFDIDAGAAQRAGLRVSSQLLRLAVSVRGAVS